MIGSGSHLSDDPTLKDVDLQETNTVLLNFQTGQGKTRLLHEYIKDYLALNKGVVFYCAPFKRLLKQNQVLLEKLKVNDKVIKLYNFIDEPKVPSKPSYGFAESHLTAQVFMMTPEFLLGSGGRDFVPQAYRKETMLSDLVSDLKAENRKVMLIIDEIHEETAAYQSYYLPRLYQLKPVIQKIFIASATFTRESVEATKAISLLTKRTIVVYQADRKPQPVRAELHLHVCTDSYSSKNLLPLHGLSEIINRLEPAQRVHISTAYKSMTDALIKKGNGTAADALLGLTPKIRVLTGGTDKKFDQTRHSIGTTFRTGVDIESQGDVLIIILPGIGETSKQERYYGTFSDGLVAILQSLARLRNGGEVHIFMPPFRTYIQTENPDQNRVMERLIRAVSPPSGPSPVPYDTEEDSFTEFGKRYSKKQKELTKFLKSVDNTSSKLRESYQEHIGMKRFYDFVLSDYNAYKMAEVYSQGKELIPLLFYLALRDQFVTCSLKSIQFERNRIPTIHLGGSHEVKSNLLERLPTHLDNPTQQPLFEMLNEAIIHLDKLGSNGSQPTYSSGNEANTRKEGTIAKLVIDVPAVAKALLRICTESCQISVRVDSPVKLFKILIENATTDCGAIGERYYAVHTMIANCRQALCDLAIVDGNKRFVKATIVDSMSSELWTELTTALDTLCRHDPYYKHSQVMLPGRSAKRSDSQPTRDELQTIAEKLVTDPELVLNGKTIILERKAKYRRPPLEPDAYYCKLRT